MHSSSLQKILLFALILLLLIGFNGGEVRAEDPAQLYLPVRIGGDYNYPPYEYLDQDGLPTGYNVELTQAVARVMGMEINIQLASWSEMRQALEKGDVDLLMGMAHTEDRLGEVEFSIPHAKVHQSIWIRDDNTTIRSVKDMVGKEVIVMKGSVMHDYMLEHEITSDLYMVQTLADALRLLASGHHDCALVAKLPGEYLLSDPALNNIHPIARPLVAQDYGFAVKRGNLELLGRFNEGLSLLKKSGEYRQIRERWLGVLQPEPISWKNVIRYGTLIIGPLVLVLVAFALWSWTLRRQVFLRTEELEREIAERMRSAEELQIRQKQLLHADKMTSLGILVAGVAHEINNPNGLIQLSLPQLTKAHKSIEPILDDYYQQHGDFKLGWFDYSRMRQEIPKMLEEMLESSNRIKRIVEDLKDFARRNDSGLDDMADLNKVVRSALRLVDNAIRKATRHFQVDYCAALPCFRGNGHRIEQVVVNLVLNACQALTSVDQAIRLRTYEHQEDNMVVLEVRDQGCGLDEDNLRRITDPFFTTKRKTGGTGLGLSVSEGIVKDHHGRLEFSSQPQQGMVVRLFLPIYEERQ
ncbi:amino acid-binding domain sensor histidine kinase [Desulfuromusa kysingii]|uniref:histidine kinase n=1 Tax=Desulfuromusa kysingii TaxID=37625 RepID=A0A1H3X088_9BACT|nr:transporter substrate-binding domain-containing protein [Desulfuromusa kysingii]SDZ92650.1 amino acid-binding domain sensor histidine kinase [Desulfuromusa kysingii]